MHDLDGYILKRAMDVDDAKADDTYDDWSVIELELEPADLYVLHHLARKKGISLSGLVAAIAEKRARDDLRALLAAG